MSANFRTTSLKGSGDDITEMCIAFFNNFYYAVGNGVEFYTSLIRERISGEDLQNETELTLIEDPRRITSTNDVNYNLALLVQNEIQKDSREIHIFAPFRKNEGILC